MSAVDASRAGTPSRAELFDTYRMLVDMADRVSGRRATANGFFLTLQTALAAYASFPVSTGAGAHVDVLSVTVTAIVGILVSLAWFLMLRSYRQLNGAKFEVIETLERQLFEIKPFQLEWEILKRQGSTAHRYLELGTVERVAPLGFALVYLVAAVRMVTR